VKGVYGARCFVSFQEALNNPAETGASILPNAAKKVCGVKVQFESAVVEKRYER
jgi:hypothetical protein